MRNFLRSAARREGEVGPRRVLACAVSLLFVAGSAGEVYGLHDCPHHHPASPPPAAPGSGAPSPGQSSHGPAPEDGPLQPSSQGPCTCIGTCHGGATAPATALNQPTPSLSSGPTRKSAGGSRPASAPSRDATALLPFPTGPPAREDLTLA